jgi:hypothetical protein
MSKLVGVLQITRSRKLLHVVPVEVISDGPHEAWFIHSRSLCGVHVTSEPEDLDLTLATCARCSARADSLAQQ